MFDWYISDADRVVFQNDRWQIRWHCLRGYEPWFSLHRKHSFLGMKWWSGIHQMAMSENSLRTYMDRWDSFPESIPKDVRATH